MEANIGNSTKEEAVVLGKAFGGLNKILKNMSADQRHAQAHLLLSDSIRCNRMMEYNYGLGTDLMQYSKDGEKSLTSLHQKLHQSLSQLHGYEKAIVKSRTRVTSVEHLLKYGFVMIALVVLWVVSLHKHKANSIVTTRAEFIKPTHLTASSASLSPVDANANANANAPQWLYQGDDRVFFHDAIQLHPDEFKEHTPSDYIEMPVVDEIKDLVKGSASKTKEKASEKAVKVEESTIAVHLSLLSTNYIHLIFSILLAVVCLSFLSDYLQAQWREGMIEKELDAQLAILHALPPQFVFRSERGDTMNCLSPDDREALKEVGKSLVQHCGAVPMFPPVRGGLEWWFFWSDVLLEDMGRDW